MARARSSRGDEVHYLRPKIRRALLADGWKVWTNHGSAASGRGRSDLFILAAGRFIAMEVKNAFGTATDPQIDELRDVQAHGGYSCIARSIEQARRFVRRVAQGEIMAQMEEMDLSFLDDMDDAPPTPHPAVGRADTPANSEDYDIFADSDDENVEITEADMRDAFGDPAPAEESPVQGLTNVPAQDLEPFLEEGPVSEAEALKQVGQCYILLGRSLMVLATAKEQAQVQAPTTSKRGRPKKS